MPDTKSEVRDGMRIDWDVPITMDDGLVLRADVFRPVDRRQATRSSSATAPTPRASRSRKAIRAPGSAWSSEHPDVARGSTNKYQSWEVVDPEKWVPRRLRLRARRLARRRPLARLHRPLLAARDARLLRMHRVGRRAAVVERQGRPQRHLLLRHQPVAGRLAAAAASGGDVHLGRRGRLVPRHDAPRRHPLHVLGQLVRHAGQDRAVRPRRARPAQPRHRRTGVRRRDAVRPASSTTTAAISATTSSPTRWTTTITSARSPTGTRSPCRSCPPPTGAARACIRAATSKASCAPRRSTNGWKRTASSTGRTSTPTTACSCRSVSSTTSSRARTTAGASSRACSCRCGMSTSSSSARGRMADRAHAVDQVVSRAGGLHAWAPRRPPPAARSSFDALGDGVTFISPPLEQDTEITGPLAAKLFVSSSTTDADLFLVFRVFTPDLREVTFMGAIDPHTPIAQGWLRASHRKLDAEAVDAVPAVSHPRRGAAAHAGRSRSSSTSSCGRPPSWCRRATASR